MIEEVVTQITVAEAVPAVILEDLPGHHPLKETVAVAEAGKGTDRIVDKGEIGRTLPRGDLRREKDHRPPRRGERSLAARHT